MSTRRSPQLGLEQVVATMLCIGACLQLFGCASTPPPSPGDGEGTWAGRPIGAAPAPKPGVKRAMIARATAEWEYFGRQTVVYRGKDESIPHVGYWEDDDETRSARVNMYWRAVGKGNLTGMDCRQPWSAAFMSWVIQGAGVPAGQFRPASAHRDYLSQAIDEAVYPGRWFVPRRIDDYSPEPGDLICASRGSYRPRTLDGYTSASMLNGAHTHCDLVVEKKGGTLEAIGGNVRNSVSRVSVELDSKGHLQKIPRRPWFIILQNRL